MKGRPSVATFGAALACAGLFGCGGGGGGGGDSGLPQPPSTPITITASNINQVTDASLDPAVGGTGVFGASTSSADTPQSNPGVVLRAMQAVSSQAQKPRSTSSGLSDAPVTEPCALSGSVTFDQSGTSATIRFNACSDAIGQVINGSVTATGIVEGTTSFQANFNVDITFTESGSQPLRMVGNFSISENCPTATTCTGTFSGSSLGAAHGSEVWFISSFNITSVENAGVFQVTASYTVASSDLNGSVSVITDSPILIQVGTGTYPHGGVIRVTGANNSSAVITINSSTPSDVNAVTVQIDLAPGDGATDITSNFSWNALEQI